jgi:hypothetical protein
MSYADGYDGKAGRGNLHLLRGGDMLYPTGALCVVHHRNTNSQKIFSKHAPGRVACICVHPGGELVASGETGKSPRLLVWSGHTMQLVCEVKGLLPAPTAEELGRKKAGGLAGGSPLGLSCVSFSSGGDPLVVVVAGDAENTVTVVDYRSNEVCRPTPRIAFNLFRLPSHDDVTRYAEFSTHSTTHAPRNFKSPECESRKAS